MVCDECGGVYFSERDLLFLTAERLSYYLITCVSKMPNISSYSDACHCLLNFLEISFKPL
jgi:hypothetical protein